MKRREFLKRAGLVGAASLIAPLAFASEVAKTDSSKTIVGSGLRLSFFPYELQLRHAFNLAKYSRTTTPDVLVKL